jgi:Zn-dependent protease with chaperone function
VAAVRSHEATGNFEAAPTELRARALYRAVIALTSIYYYASIPVLVIITAGAAAGIVWLFLSVGRVPVKLMLFVLAAALYTLVAVVRSAFARVRDEDPGRPLSREEAPALWELADDVAARVNTRPVDAVYVTPGTGLGVMERGSATKRIRGLGRRCLVLGLGALEGMTQSQFGAILAHEYGHFAGRDTAGGDLARHVQVSMMRMAQGLAENGQASWHNPAWLFVNAFHRLFVRVTHGASRLQEILADRTAVATCGTEAFASGLLHVIRRSIAFDWQVNDEVRRAAKEGRAVGNLYALALPEKDDPEARIDQRVQEILDQPPSPYDTHPVVTDRIDLAMRMNVGAAGPGGQSPAWGLIPNAAGLQEEMTALVRANVEQMSQRRHLRNRRRSER